MQKVIIDELEDVPHFMGANTVRKPLSRAVEGMGFAMNYFELDAGEGFSGGLHTHHDQEELFYVEEGTATFEVREEPDGESEAIAVGPGEAIHFARDDAYTVGQTYFSNLHRKPTSDNRIAPINGQRSSDRQYIKPAPTGARKR